jgi:hypothetical protein
LQRSLKRSRRERVIHGGWSHNPLEKLKWVMPSSFSPILKLGHRRSCTDAPSLKGKVSLEKKLMKLSGVFRYGVLRFFFFFGIFYLPLSLRFIHTRFCFLFPNRHLLQIFICKLWSPLLLLSSCLRRRSGDGDGILLARIHQHLIMLEPLCHQVVSKPRHQPHKQLCLSSSSKQQELLGSLCKQWVQRGQPAGDKGSWQLGFWQQQVLAPVLSQR